MAFPTLTSNFSPNLGFHEVVGGAAPNCARSPLTREDAAVSRSLRGQGGTLRVQAINSPGRFEFTTGGTGVVGYAGAALLGELADRLEHVGWG